MVDTCKNRSVLCLTCKPIHAIVALAASVSCRFEDWKMAVGQNVLRDEVKLGQGPAGWRTLDSTLGKVRGQHL